MEAEAKQSKENQNTHGLRLRQLQLLMQRVVEQESSMYRSLVGLREKKAQYEIKLLKLSLFEEDLRLLSKTRDRDRNPNDSSMKNDSASVFAFHEPSMYSSMPSPFSYKATESMKV